MSDSARAIRITLRSGEVVQGWDFGETPLGHYVALDPAASHIRFIPHGDWSSMSWQESDEAKFGRQRLWHDKEEAADSPVELDVQQALGRTDFNEVRRISQALEELRVYFYGDYHELRIDEKRLADEPRDEADIVLSARYAYLRLIQQTERSGLLGCLREHSNTFRGSPLPRFELLYFGPGDHPLLLETMYLEARRRETSLPHDGGAQALSEVRPSELVQAVRGAAIHGATPTEQAAEGDQLPRRLKIISAVGKMVVGGGLAAANICAGISVSVMTALPSLGVGAVAGAIGVATSAYTGLNAGLDGIKDLATALERK